MTERAIAPRKSQLFLHSVIPVTKSRDEVVQQKLKKGKFPWTVTGCLQVVACVIYIATITLFVSKESCQNSSEWRKYLLPASTGLCILCTMILYLLFSFGLTVKKPGLYVTIDIIALLLLSILEIGSAVATMLDCTGMESLKKVPEIIGIIGSVCLLSSCAALILMYRYREYEDDDEFVKIEMPKAKNQNRNIHLSRKSIAV